MRRDGRAAIVAGLSLVACVGEARRGSDDTPGDADAGDTSNAETIADSAAEVGAETREDGVAGGDAGETTACVCLMEGACFKEGDVAPENPCLVCRPIPGTTSWAALPGIGCDDGDPCSSSEACGEDGACAGSWDDFDDEPNDTRDEAPDLGTITPSTFVPLEFPSGTVGGNLGSGADRDLFAWDMTYTTVTAQQYVPQVLLSLGGLTTLELCLFASCEQSFALFVDCEVGTEPSELDADAIGCCRPVVVGDTLMRLDMICDVAPGSRGTAYARLRATGAPDGASCGGYSLKWGAVLE